ncbi:MAG: hypothetical protein VX610_10345 [SAR324 cluster bacterium]|nr:hypothetical protein [SAR324 cluster bacterium]
MPVGTANNILKRAGIKQS